MPEAIDAGGLVEALVAIHVPTKCWGNGARMDACQICSETYPCETIRLVCAATGSAVPEQRKTGCDGMLPSKDGDGWNFCQADRGHEPNGCRPHVEVFGF